MTVFYFTSTGNCLEVAKKLGGNAVSIASVLKGDEFTFKDDTIGIVTPNYQGDLPKPVKDFISRAKLKAKYIFGIVTYGFMNGNINLKMKTLGEKHGISFDYVNSLLMVDNSFVYFDMEKELQKLPKKNVDAHMKIIKDEVLARKKKIYSSNFVIKGFANIMDKVRSSNTEEFSQNFKIDRSCINCGLCKKVCPINNITMKDKPIIHDGCIRCGACWHHCPKHAIHYNGEKSKMQYINTSVTLQEIVKANS